MTIRNLDFLFHPRSVAVVGASRRPGSVGEVLMRNLLRAGFGGPIMPVHPKADSIAGVLAYPDVASLPVAPDLGVIATPPETVPQIIAELGAKGARAAVVITAGFSEGGAQRGIELEQAMLEAARPHTLRIVGPNCVGVQRPNAGLNATFAHLDPTPGKLAFVTQSGAIVTSVLDWAQPRGIGFSHMVSLGDMADVDFADMLDYLANDSQTTGILLYMEGLKRARKFLSAARAAARMKPVVVVKAGRHAESAKAAASHTGSLAGADDVFDAAFRRAGMLRVDSLEELFAAVETLATTRPPRGDRMAILTNGGGMGVLATDALLDECGRVAELSPATMAKLDEVLPPTWSHGNPIDLVGDAGAERYAAALRVVLDDKGVDAVLVLNCPAAVVSATGAARAVVEVVKERPRAPVFTCWVGDATAREARRIFGEQGLPTYQTPREATRAFMELVSYQRSQELLMETPPSVPEEFTPDLERARQLVDAAMAAKREWLTEDEAKQMLTAYGVPTVPTWVAEDPERAGALADEAKGPVALKILSPDITHKSDVGGVELDLRGGDNVRAAAAAMLERVRAVHPEAAITGFTVQPMVQRPGSFELLVGAVEDRQFGPVLMFGQGGTAVELIDDKALALPPLNMVLAREAISRTRIHKLLRGYRDRPPVDFDALCLCLIRIAQLVIDLPEVIELDINPLLSDAAGVIALDARVRVREPERPGQGRLAIKPYPRELERLVPLGDGRELLLRPIRPEDEPPLHDHFARLTPEEIRMRFMVPVKTMTHVMAARFTQLDYDRDMALVLTDPGIAGRTEIHGVVRLSCDPDKERAEYAIILRGDLTGMGLGIVLMRYIIDYAKEQDVGEIWGHVLRENRSMRKLCKVLGFEERYDREEPEITEVRLRLREPASGR